MNYESHKFFNIFFYNVRALLNEVFDSMEELGPGEDFVSKLRIMYLPT